MHTFSSLSIEVRVMIYKQLLMRHSPLPIYGPSTSTSSSPDLPRRESELVKDLKALSLVTNQVNEEASTTFYSKNVFLIAGSTSQSAFASSPNPSAHAIDALNNFINTVPLHHRLNIRCVIFYMKVLLFSLPRLALPGGIFQVVWPESSFVNTIGRAFVT
jgi:hypothetical protein